MEELIGKKINHLLVIKRGEDYVSPLGKHIKRWLCLCDCQIELPEDEQKYVLIPQGRLLSGKAWSCNCHSFIKKIKSEDLTNYKFGKFTVIKQVDKPNHIKTKGVYWLCLCNCGNERIIRYSDIKRKHMLSCGECSRNIFHIDGKYGIGITTKGEEFYFDLEDYELIKPYTWCINRDGYVIAWCRSIQKFIYMHRLIHGLKHDEKIIVDHISHINHDNRKEELRVCTNAENSRNCKLSKNNTSGVTGVIWASNMNMWQSQIMINYKTIKLGYFENFDDAVKTRKDAEEKYFGKFKFEE